MLPPAAAIDSGSPPERSAAHGYHHHRKGHSHEETNSFHIQNSIRRIARKVA
jgi:hypothetical protein